MNQKYVQHHQIPFWKNSYGTIRWLFLIGLGSYLVLLSKSTYYLGIHQDQQSSGWSDADGPLNLHMQYRQAQRRYQQFYFSSSSDYVYYPAKWFLQRTSQVEDAQLQMHLKATDRQQRTRPAATAAAPAWHSIASINDPRPYQALQKDMLQAKHVDASKTATVDQLCGSQAQNASISHPLFYPSRTALNSNSRVLITGILSPMGVSLALHLKEKCGVEQIAGVDAMYPNTVYNRLVLQDRIKLLTTKIPKLVKPMFLPYVGLDPMTKDSTTSTREEMNWMEGFEPTHIVHLASYSMEVLYNDALVDPEWKNTRSPYVTERTNGKQGGSSSRFVTDVEDPFLYPMRSSMAAMEQLLQSIALVPEKERPQLVFAKQDTPVSPLTSSGASKNSKQQRHASLFEALKRMDDLLVDAYHAHTELQLPSIGLKLPNTIFGPWGNPGSVMHDMIEKALEIQQEALDPNSTMATNGARTTTTVVPAYASPMSRLDLLFMDDAVDAIVSAMQYRTEQPITVSVPALVSSSAVATASTIQSFLKPTNSTFSGNKENPFLEKLLTQNGKDITEGQATQLELNAKSLIVPPKKTPLKDGIVKSIAWHLDRLSPFGPPVVERGDDFLQRHHQQTCAPHDVMCHKSFEYLPCSSECSVHHQCLPSIFDSVVDLVHTVSDGCDIVLYTQSLGYNVEDMDLHAEYMDDKDLDDDELLVCNFAFVPRDSDLVKSVSGKVPNDQLAKFGIKPEASDASSKAMMQKKLDGLNGRLLYRGWILIWVDDGLRPLAPTDRSLLKLSPSQFFHPGVRFGLFVEENFSVSPNLEDVLFLADEMKRRSLPVRTLKKEEKVETPRGGVVTKKIKYRIPKEPPRRAAILFAPLRYPNIDDPIVEQYRNGKRKLSIYDASKFMRFEVGYEQREKESASLRRQREYYERVPSYINKNTELRSNYEPWYRYSMRHWVRTRWVVHDFNLEDARLLRCDWYQEHIQWGNDLDQLSFANVAATRELKRRMAHQEPDDHIKTFIEEHPELHGLTDSYEWHALETDTNKLHREPTSWNSHYPEHVQVVIDSAGKQEEREDVADEEMPLYVRIMSERVMAASRKIWTKARKQILKAKQTRKKHA
jgi:nucleoside-diphosphate-sugar epimerase